MSASYTEITPQCELEVEDVTPCYEMEVEQTERSYEMEVEEAREIYRGGTKSHNDPTDRDVPDQHPINAITGLSNELDNRVQKRDGMGLSSNDFTDVDRDTLQYLGEGEKAEILSNIEIENILKKYV